MHLSIMAPILFLCLLMASTGHARNVVILSDSEEEVDLVVWQDMTIFRNQQPRVNIVQRNVVNDTLETIKYLCKNYSPGKTVVLDLTRDCFMSDVASMTFTPYIRPMYTACHCNQSTSLLPTQDTVIKVAFDYIKQQRNALAKIIIFAETCQYDISVINNMGITVPILLINQRTVNIEEWMRKILRVTSRHYSVAIGSASQVNHILCAAFKVGLPETFIWMVHVLDNIAQLNRSCIPSRYILINSSIANTFHSQIIQESIDKEPKIVPLFWSWMETALPSLNDGINGSVCTDKVHGVTNSVSPPQRIDPDEFILSESVNRGFKRLGKWTQSEGYLEDKMTNQENPKHLVVVTIHEPPFIFRAETENGTKYTGYSIDVFDQIASRLGLTYSLYEVADGQYGIKKSDGSWTGIVGDILKGKADMAVAPLSVTSEREQVIDFTSPYFDFAGIQIMMKKPDVSSSLFAFTYVFSSEVWYCWFAVLSFTGLGIYIFEILSPFSPRNTPGKYYTVIDKPSKIFNLSDSFYYIAASLSLRGPEYTPTTTSTRILIAGFWFFCTVMMGNYIGNLAAVQTTNRLSVPINSLDDLSKQTEIKYSLKEGTTTQDYFDRMAKIETNFYDSWRNMSYATDSLKNQKLAVFDYPLGDQFLTIKASIDRTGLLKTSQEGLEKVLNENFAMFHESPMLQYEKSRDCRIIAVGKQFSSKPYALALPQHSQMTKLFSQTILQLQAEVVLDKLKQKWWQGGNSTQTCITIDESQGLTFHSVGGIFLMIAFGMVICVVIFLVEILWSMLRPVSKPMQPYLVEQNSRTNLVDEGMDDKQTEDTNEESHNL